MQAPNPAPALEEPYQAILEVLALASESVTLTNLAKMLAALPSRTPAGRAWSTTHLGPYIDTLAGDGHMIAYPPQCAAHLREPIARALVASGRFGNIAGVVRRVLPTPRSAQECRSTAEASRPVRLAYYGDSPEQTAAVWDEWAFVLGCLPLVELTAGPGGAPLESLAPPLFDRLAREVFRIPPLALPATRTAIRGRMPTHVATPHASDEVRVGWADDLWWRGRPDDAVAALGGLDTPAALSVRARVALGRGALAEARATFERAEKARGKLPPIEIDGLLYVTTLLAIGAADALAHARMWLGRPDRAALPVFQDLGRALAHVQTGAAPGFTVWDYSKCTDVTALFEGLARAWTHTPIPDGMRIRIAKLDAGAEAAGLDWVRGQIARLLVRSGTPALRDLVRAREPWRLKLEALGRIPVGAAPTPTPAVAPASTLRLAWFLTLHAGTNLSFAPREQKRSGNVWTGGRPIALKRLHESLADYNYVTEQDRRICAQIRRESTHDHRGYENVSYTFNHMSALLALVGHPLLYWAEAPDGLVTLALGEPALVIARDGEHLVVRMDPPSTSMLAVRRTDPDALELVMLSDAHRQIAKVLEGEVRVPATAEAELRAVVEALAGQVPVHASIRGWGARTVVADASPIARLSPAGSGLKVRFLIRPFGASGTTLELGGGAATVMGRLGSETVQAERDLAEEQRVLSGLVAVCPALEGAGADWSASDDESALAVLLELGRLADPASGRALTLEWPANTPIRRVREVGAGGFQLRVKKDGDWFAATGTLRFDEDLSMELEAFLALLDVTPGRFLPLGDGRFAALTEGFRDRLEALRRVGTLRAGKLRFHPLFAPVVDELSSEGGAVGGDAAFRALLARIAAAEADEPALPSTLVAQLRPYQVEGYRWLCRLADRGAGACLADDMGVGKTLQALALLVRRAPDGPALVVAPTSVCGNWLDEALRFAPTLVVRRFGEGDRDAALAAAGPFTVLVCSFGLLQSEADRLAALRWHTVVLDEAQQIKNSGTQRFKAAVRLQADFRMVCSGTPVENHLGELWSLLRFLNPGLLGTEAEFRTRFQLPIERDRSPYAAAALRRIVRPFVLRRTKADVLRELPSRTEVTVHVELSAEEAALYEALRRRALEAVADASERGPSWRFRILAEITRLRQAACNPRLVLEDGAVAPSSAKLTALAELVDTLRAGGHKALVFSQFVRHLALVREMLDERGISYQYLDGSTPTAARTRAVRAFQGGEGDLFLISLRAGGTGLNLTAADYVVHLDPWWNPAVEDQASDRAHRIGQQRPVTIYRMVATGTIEERIVALHHAKRELAASLLDGADGRLAAEDLLALLGE